MDALKQGDMLKHSKKTNELLTPDLIKWNQGDLQVADGGVISKLSRPFAALQRNNQPAVDMALLLWWL